jgi:hypothetical protein
VDVWLVRADGVEEFFHKVNRTANPSRVHGYQPLAQNKALN